MALDDPELRSLLGDLESDRVERKQLAAHGSFDTDRVCQAICAFANDLPNHRQAGVVFLA